MAFSELVAQGMGPHAAALQVGAQHGQAMAAAAQIAEMARQRKKAAQR